MNTNLRNINARTQADLVENSQAGDTMEEELLEEHPLNIYGFSTISGGAAEPMAEEQLSQTIRTLLQSRPSGRLYDVKPRDIPVKEVKLANASTAAFRYTMKEKAEAIAKEMARNYKACGFKMELHNIDEGVGKASVSISLYETLEEPLSPQIPCSVFVRWRKNF